MNLGREFSILLAVSFLVDLGMSVFFPLVGRSFLCEIAWHLANGNSRQAARRFKYDGARLAIVVSRSYAK